MERKSTNLVFADKLFFINTEDIVVDDGYFESLPEEEYKKLKDSILNLGLIYPLVLQKIGKKYRLIDGRNRLRVLLELGVDIVPALLINEEAIKELDPEQQDNFGTLVQMDIELYRRHLENNVRKLKDEERNHYFKYLKRHLIQKTYSILKLNESQNPSIQQNLTAKHLTEVIGFYSNLKKASSLDLNFQLAKRLIDTSINSSINQTHSNNVEELKRQIKQELRQIYELDLEAKTQELQEKEKELMYLKEQLKQYEKQYNQLDKEYQHLIKKGKNLKEKIEERLKQEYENKIAKLESELRKIKATKVLEYGETFKEVLEEYKEKFKKEQEDLEKEKAEIEARYRQRLEEFKKQVETEKNKYEAIRVELEKEKSNLAILTAEKNRLTEKVNSLLSILSKATSFDSLESIVDTLRKNLDTLLQIIINNKPISNDLRITKFKNIWNDTVIYFKEVDSVIQNWIKEQESFLQSQSEQNLDTVVNS